MEIPQLSDKDVSRFWSKVAITAQEDKCWVWTEGKRRRGYGRFSITIGKNKDKGFVTSRVAYFLANGECPEDKVVCHRCDNTSCCNPKHLFLGTNKDNTQDMMQKGRHTTPVGSKHGMSKITEQDVYKIRELYSEGGTYRSIAEIYKVNYSCIRNIIKGVNWGWLI